VKHPRDILWPKVHALWEEGLTTREIGQKLGLTKNAICGLIYRMRQHGVVMSPTKNKPIAPQPKPKPVEEKVVVVKLKPPKPPKQPPPLPLFEKLEPPPAPEPVEQQVIRLGIKFIDLKAESCRYVISGRTPDQFRFCGDPKKTGAYCAEHAALCYVPLSKSAKPSRPHNYMNPSRVKSN
jgi:GcrA cell cycle regulator